VPLPRDFADVELLLLGGTSFLGRHAAGIALERGHEVILFHCRSGAEGPYQVEEHLHGDRDGGLSVLEGRTWDAVIDASGYVPRVVQPRRQSLRRRAPRA